MKFTIRIILFTACLGMSFFSCQDEKQNTESNRQPVMNDIPRPDFSADSAYQYVQKQVSFGPRVPGTNAHTNASIWLRDKLGSFADSSFIQEGSATMYNNEEIPVRNIIGQFNPENPNRILLAAHWDSRHIADKESDEEVKNDPIPGANDGASGVGVLLEVARQLKTGDSQLGVDIIFFDAEDLGSPEGSKDRKSDTWCLGSQYWAQNPHTPDYRAGYGILLDMVGAQDAVFRFEEYAYRNAAPLYTRTWNNALSLGYDYLFQKKPGGGIIDDHLYVTRYRGFPMIDIIDFDPNRRPDGFGAYHHTQDDNMDVIDKNTLQAVGEVVLATIRR